MTNEQRISQAIHKLREARELLKAASATRTVKRVRLAISSAAGAKRHASNMDWRKAAGRASATPA